MLYGIATLENRKSNSYEETPGIRRFWIQVPELERFDFLPGQFVTIDLPIHENPINAGAVIPSPPGPMVPMCLNW
jgi:hypothetical protein